MIVTAVVLAIIAALVEKFAGGIQEPWKKLIWIGIVVLFVLGLVLLLAPGIIPLRTF